jgi:hypothetical protein
MGLSYAHRVRLAPSRHVPGTTGSGHLLPLGEFFLLCPQGLQAHTARGHEIPSYSVTVEGDFVAWCLIRQRDRLAPHRSPGGEIKITFVTPVLSRAETLKSSAGPETGPDGCCHKLRPRARNSKPASSIG